MKTVDPFKSWLSEQFKSRWFISLVALLSPIILTPPPAIRKLVQWVVDLIATDREVDYALINLVLNLVVTIVAVALVVPYREKIGKEKFLSLLKKEFETGGFFEILNVNAEDIVANSKIASKVHKVFSRMVLFFFLSIGLIYVIFILKLIFKSETYQQAFSTLEIAVSCLSSVILLIAYYRLTYYRASQYITTNKILAISFGFAAICTTNAALTFGSENWEVINFWFHGGAGVIAGVTFALLIGKMDSQMIGTPTWLLMLMFLYAMFQPLFILFGDQGICDQLGEQYLQFLLYPTLLLKILMYLYFLWLIRRNRIITHIIFSPVIDRRIQNDAARMSNILNQAQAVIKPTKEA